MQRSDLQAFLDASKTGPAGASEVRLAIFAAGKTNDPFWIPYLKPFLKYAQNRNSNLSDLAGSAQLALAKLGERAQLQEIACEVEYGSPLVQYDAVRSKLTYVNGWFAVSKLAGWLEDNYRPKELLRAPPGDAIYLRPQELALKFLPEIVPNPPFSAPAPLWLQSANEEKLAPQRQAWREWLHQNEGSLRKLMPTNEGIDTSESACKRILADDLHVHR